MDRLERAPENRNISALANQEWGKKKKKEKKNKHTESTYKGSNVKISSKHKVCFLQDLACSY